MLFHSVDSHCDRLYFCIKEKQLKKVKAKQRRLQAILGGEDAQRVEDELLAECDDEEGELLLSYKIFFFNLTEITFYYFTNSTKKH